MSDNEKQSHLFLLVELLFMPMTFYVLSQFDKITTWKQGLLWCVIFALIQNEYVSIKDSSPKYNIFLYLLDLLSLFVYLFALRSIFKFEEIIGYDPLFWVYLSVLWLSYGIWDWIMVFHEKDPPKKDDYKRWRNGMIICFLITILCGLALFSISIQPASIPNMVIISILQILPFGCVVWSLCGWWLLKAHLNRLNK